MSGVAENSDEAGERQALLRPASASARPPRTSEGQIRSTSPSLLLLVLLLTLSAGSNYAESCLGPLKSLLVAELDLTNAQYGVISSATQLSNTIVPLLCGLFIDLHGASRVARLATLSVVLGCVGAAIALECKSYPGLVIAKMVQGLGVIAVDMAAVKLLVLWFRDAGWLGLAISIDFAFARLLGVVGKATAIPIAQFSWSSPSSFSTLDEAAPKASRTFWVASAVASLSFFASLAYLGLDRDSESQGLRQRRRVPDRRSSLGTMLKSAASRALRNLPAFFVVIAATQFYQPIAVFNNLSADIIRWKGQSARQAGWTASMGQVASIFVAPWLGFLFDRHGHRMEFVPLTAFLLATCMALLAYTDLSPIVAMVIFSLANAINTPPYLCSLAILLGQKGKASLDDSADDSALDRNRSGGGGGDETFGFAWGLWKSLMSSYQIIMYTTLGWLQDFSSSSSPSSGGQEHPGKSYQSVLLELLLSKIVELLFGISYVLLDRKYARGILASNEDRRQTIEEEVKRDGHFHGHGHGEAQGRDSALLRPQRWSNVWAIVHFSASIATAWVLFLVVAFAPHFTVGR